MVLAAYIAGGHVLIEDVPGLGKRPLFRHLRGAWTAASSAYNLPPMSFPQTWPVIPPST
jgi:MoxR-like ATPase